MIKLAILLLLLGGVVLGMGIRFTDSNMRKIGMGLLGAGLVILLFGRFLDIELVPSV